MNKLLNKLSGYKIAFGHVTGENPVMIDELQKVIRTKDAYDWEKILPKISGEIAKNLNLEQSEEMSNYISDWLLTGAANDTSSQAKEFQKAMRENPKYAELLIKTQLEFQEENNLDIMEKLRRRIEFERKNTSPAKERAKKFFEEMYTHWVDSLNPVNNLVKNVEKNLGREIKESLNPAKAFWRYRGSTKQAEVFVEGTEKALSGLKKAFPRIKFDGFKSLATILNEIGAVGEKGETVREDFSIFVTAWCHKDLHKLNKETDEKIQALKAKLETVDDKKKYLLTDKSVVDAVNSIDNASQSNWLMRFLHSLMGVVRASMTVSNPDFSVGNLLRDSQDAAIYSKHGFIPVLDTIKGFMAFWNFDKTKNFAKAFEFSEEFWEWQASGAAQSSFVSAGRDYVKNMLDTMTKSKKQRMKEHPLDFVLETMQAFSEFTEYSTRIGEYRKVKAKLAEGRENKRTTFNDVVTAAIASRDLMDFSRSGTSGRALNSISAFSNAAIQGMDKFARTFDPRKLKTKDGRKEWQRAAIRLALLGMLPALLQALAFGDEEWYKEMEDWEKDTNWIVGEGVKIPKGMDFGIRFSWSLITKLLSDEKVTAQSILKPVRDSLPEWKPTAIMPLIESMANYSFFLDRPIVPQREKELPAEKQYNANTSEIAKSLGRMFDYSPRKIDHLMSGYFGTFFGRQIPRLIDTALTDKKLDTSLSALPLTRRIFFDTFKNPKTVSEYYEVKKRQTELHNDFKLTGKKPEGYDPAMYERIQKSQKAMQNISKQERAIIDSVKMPVEEQKRKLKELQLKKIQMIKKILGN